MPARRCLGCSRITTNGSRCLPCQKANKVIRNAEAPIARRVKANATSCGICGEGPRANDPWQMDHIIPLVRGGRAVPGNIQPAHESCNKRKHAR